MKIARYATGNGIPTNINFSRFQNNVLYIYMDNQQDGCFFIHRNWSRSPMITITMYIITVFGDPPQHVQQAQQTCRCYGKRTKFFKVYRVVLCARIQTKDDLIPSTDMKQLGTGIGNWELYWRVLVVWN